MALRWIVGLIPQKQISLKINIAQTLFSLMAIYKKGLTDKKTHYSSLFLISTTRVLFILHILINLHILKLLLNVQKHATCPNSSCSFC